MIKILILLGKGAVPMGSYLILQVSLSLAWVSLELNDHWLGDCVGSQYTPSNTTADFLLFCTYLLGSDITLQPVRKLPLLFPGFRFWCFHYSNYGRLKTTLCVTAMAALLSGIEALLIFTLRVSFTPEFDIKLTVNKKILHNKGVRWLDLIVGIMGAVLLVAGILPAYFEIWKRDGRVIGISELA